MYKFVRNFKQKNSNNKSSDDASLSSSIKTTTIKNNNVERSNLNDAAVITTTIINEPNNNTNKRSDITYTSLSTNSQVRKSFTIINNNKNTQPKQSEQNFIFSIYLFLSLLNLFFLNR
jgi:hypothetical protein